MNWLKTNKNDILRLQEHEIFPKSEESFDMFNELKKLLEYHQPTQILNELQFLGMDLVPYRPQLQMSYYIGVDWIDKKKGIAMEVLPKIRYVDFQEMLKECFMNDEIAKQIDRIFYIRDDDKYISIPDTDFQLEPFVLITFLNLVNSIVKKGLKSNYVTLEDQLDGKIKGKIMVSKYLKHGFANGHKGTIDCKYQEYSTNCIENQILKTALYAIKKMMIEQKNLLASAIFKHAKDILASCLPAFEQVSLLSDSRRLHSIHISPIFAEYKSAIRLAQMILRKEGVGISQESEYGYQLVPPFIINMALLFEMYVYSLLIKTFNNKIEYQQGTKADRPDFLKKDERLIIDTKYITKWDKDVITENVRQLSGYGRSVGIRKQLGIWDDSATCPCLIVYPNIDGIETFDSLYNGLMSNKVSTLVTSVNKYQKFYKLPVKLPTI